MSANLCNRFDDGPRPNLSPTPSSGSPRRHLVTSFLKQSTIIISHCGGGLLIYVRCRFRQWKTFHPRIIGSPLLVAKPLLSRCSMRSHLLLVKEPLFLNGNYLNPQSLGVLSFEASDVKSEMQAQRDLTPLVQPSTGLMEEEREAASQPNSPR